MTDERGSDELLGESAVNAQRELVGTAEDQLWDEEQVTAAVEPDPDEPDEGPDELDPEPPPDSEAHAEYDPLERHEPELEA